MATASELVLGSQMEALEQNAALHGWMFERHEDPGFTLGLPAKDGSRFTVQVRCEG